MNGRICKKLKYAISCVVICAMVMNQTLLPAIASSNDTSSANVVTVSKDEYTPVNVAVLMDASGSIVDWNGETVSRDAAWKFINKLIGTGNKVSIYRYDDKVERLCDRISTADLTSLTKLHDIMIKKTKLDQDTQGRTRLIEAVSKAAEDLKNESEDGIKNVMILFTDGSDNGTLDEDELREKSAEDPGIMPRAISKAINNALANKTDNLIIYCVGYNYTEQTVNGPRESIGRDGNGFGAQILESLSDKTNGQTIYAEEGNLVAKFQELIDRLLFSGTNTINEFEGDGEIHDTEFIIDPSVLRASVIIDSDDSDSLAKCSITLNYLDGDGDEYKNVSVDNFSCNDKGDIWRTDDTITMTMPKPGRWSIRVEGLHSENRINVKLLKGYEIASRTVFKLTRSGSDIPLTDARSGDKLEVHAKLYSDTKEISDPGLYEHDSLQARVYFSDAPLFEENYTRNHSAKDILKDLDSMMLDYKTATFRSNELVLDNIPVNWSGTKYVSLFILSDQLDLRCFSSSAVTVGSSAPSVIKKIAPIEMMTSSQPCMINDINSYFSPFVDISLDTSGMDSSICSAEYDSASGTLTVTPKGIGSTVLRLSARSSLDSSLPAADMIAEIHVSNTPPSVTVPDSEKNKSLIVGDEITIEHISSFGTDFDSDSLEYSVSVDDEAAGHVEAVFDKGKDSITIKAVAVTEKPVGVKISALDGVESASDSIFVMVTEDPNPDPFRMLIPEQFKNPKLVLDKGKDTYVISEMHKFVKGKHAEPVEIIADTADVTDAEVVYDPASDELTIKALKKTSKLVKITVKAFDGQNTTQEEIILLTVKNPFNWRLLFGCIAGVAAAGAGAFFIIKRLGDSKKRFNFSINMLNVANSGTGSERINSKPHIVTDLDMNKPKFTLTELLDSVIDHSSINPKGVQIIREGMNAGNVRSACSSIIFQGGQPDDNCIGTISGSHPDLMFGMSERGESFEETVSGPSPSMTFTFYDGDSKVLKITISFI